MRNDGCILFCKMYFRLPFFIFYLIVRIFINKLGFIDVYQSGFMKQKSMIDSLRCLL